MVKQLGKQLLLREKCQMLLDLKFSFLSYWTLAKLYN